MQFNNTHLTYCTNAHTGNTWDETFKNLKKHTLQIKKLNGHTSFGIGLRLSNKAATELLKPSQLKQFKEWLQTNEMYVFTINGFPFGDFHHTKVKENVHYPDWESDARLEYTKKLFNILNTLLPENIDGGVSTSPISYRFWHDKNDLCTIKTRATKQLIELIKYLDSLSQQSNKELHLDIEPEPDGLIETSDELINFFNDFLIPIGRHDLSNALSITADNAEKLIRKHIRCCFDICHFSVEFEDPIETVKKLKNAKIDIGKVQISAALSGKVSRQLKKHLKPFDEPTYLHQTVIRTKTHELIRFKDLNEALSNWNENDWEEARTHFHVPLFTNQYNAIESTQNDVKKCLAYFKNKPFSHHLEIETYTWNVLPKALQIDHNESIIREINWVKKELNV
jgi:sugar phosphate isomerase/epimerase